MGRYPFLTAIGAYLDRFHPPALDRTTWDRRGRTLRRIARVLQQALDEGDVGTTNPATFGRGEVDFLQDWMSREEYLPSYRDTLWDDLNALLKFRGNHILKELEAQGLWRPPDVPADPDPPEKDANDVRHSLRLLEAVQGWRGEFLRFSVAFQYGTQRRPREIRLADRGDLDIERWTFTLMHPKDEHRHGAKYVGTVIDVFSDEIIDVRTYTLDFLAARDRRCRELGLDPATTRPLVPNENGEHYSEAGWRNARVKSLHALGLEPGSREWLTHRELRATAEQELTDRLEAAGHQQDSAIEVAAERSCHTVATAIRHYIALRSKRRRAAAKHAWEACAPKVPIRAD